MMLVAIRHPHYDHLPGEYAIIMNIQTPTVSIVCRKLPGMDWVGIHTMEAGRIGELPSCFSLSDEAKDALTRIVELDDPDPTDPEGSIEDDDEYPPCPICGDPIDYCPGHVDDWEEE